MSTIGQNKLRSLILKSIEHERLYEIDTTGIINKFDMEKSRNHNFKQLVCCLWQTTSTHPETILFRYWNDQICRWVWKLYL